MSLTAVQHRIMEPLDPPASGQHPRHTHIRVPACRKPSIWCAVVCVQTMPASQRTEASSMHCGDAASFPPNQGQLALATWVTAGIRAPRRRMSTVWCVMFPRTDHALPQQTNAIGRHPPDASKVEIHCMSVVPHITQIARLGNMGDGRHEGPQAQDLQRLCVMLW